MKRGVSRGAHSGSRFSRTAFIRSTLSGERIVRWNMSISTVGRNRVRALLDRLASLWTGLLDRADRLEHFFVEPLVWYDLAEQPDCEGPARRRRRRR